MLFRRKYTDLVEDRADASTTPEAEQVEGQPEERPPRRYTPSKREQGVTTPKRPSPHSRRPGAAQPAPARGSMTKEEKRELRAARRERRREVSEGMRQGDPRYLAARDRGPERAIARDVVDSHRTLGTWFFGGALVVLVGSAVSVQLQLILMMGWTVLLLAAVVDCVVLCRRVRRLVHARHPDSTRRMGGLYLYTAMRSITFRRMRIPLPRLSFGDSV